VRQRRLADQRFPVSRSEFNAANVRVGSVNGQLQLVRDPVPTDRLVLVVRQVAPGIFEGRLDGDIVYTSRAPFLDGARVLIARGFDPQAVVVMRHAGADHDALQATLEVAASLAVSEDRLGKPVFRRWTPPQSDADAAPPLVPEIDPAATPTRGGIAMGVFAPRRGPNRLRYDPTQLNTGPSLLTAEGSVRQR